MAVMKLRVRIDRDACLAYGDCAELAPEAFEVDDTAHLVGSAPLRQMVDAARACPTGAITLVDAETGEQIAP
jgi:ferredoxin